MDLIDIIDFVGEDNAAPLFGLLLGLAFGIVAERSAFCTRSAVVELMRGTPAGAFGVWLAGFATTLLAVQALLATGMLHVAESRFLTSPQSLSGALVGGLVFGCGMILARGCVSRLLVVAGTGNLRAFVSLVFVAIVGFLTLFGFLAVLRDWIAPFATTATIGGNDLRALTAMGPAIPFVAGFLLLGIAVWAGLGQDASLWRIGGGAAVGLIVAAGWYGTYRLAATLFDPIPVESISLVRPVVLTGQSIIEGRLIPGIDVGLAAGILAGALAASLVSGSFRLQWFGQADAPSFPRYVAGAALMGFGGVLAAGCTVGAGLTGTSILAVSAVVALGGMLAGAAITERALNGPADF